MVSHSKADEALGRAIVRGAVAVVAILIVLGAGATLAAPASAVAILGALGAALAPRVGQCATCATAPPGSVVLADTSVVATVLQIGHPAAPGGQPAQALYLADWLPNAPPELRGDTTLTAVLESAGAAPRLRLRRGALAGGTRAGAIHFRRTRPPIPVVTGTAPRT